MSPPLNHTKDYRPFGAFRFLLALLVLLHHGFYLLPEDHRAFFHATGLGVVAVAVFFAISGFIVAEANAVFYKGRPAAFLLNRFLRIVPPYIAALLLAVIIDVSLYSIGKFEPWDDPLAGSPLQPRVLLAGFLDVVPFFQPRYLTGQDFHFIPFAWSLRVEFAFYLFAFGTYVLLATRLPERLKTWVPRGAVLFAYALFFIFLILRNHVPQQLENIPYFLFGICVYRLWRHPSLFNALHLCFAAGCVAIAFPLWHQKVAPVLLYQLPILTILLGCFVFLAFQKTANSTWKKTDKFLGDLSYPLYLNQISVLLVLSRLYPQWLGWDNYLIGVMLAVLLSAVMFWIVETPLKKIRDRVRGTAL